MLWFLSYSQVWAKVTLVISNLSATGHCWYVGCMYIHNIRICLVFIVCVVSPFMDVYTCTCIISTVMSPVKKGIGVGVWIVMTRVISCKIVLLTHKLHSLAKRFDYQSVTVVASVAQTVIQILAQMCGKP